MKIYDISQEVFGCEIFPGDPTPKKNEISRIEDGELYNLTSFSMCAHNGTHVDAPFHFYKNGKTIDEVSLDKFVGFSYVAEFEGVLTGNDAVSILEKARKRSSKSAKKILIKGKAVVSSEAAEVFADAGIDLLGNESQTVGPEDAPMEVHLKLLGAEVILLEGIRLQDVVEGVYFLNAAPLLLDGSDGAPCRAILIELDE